MDFVYTIEDGRVAGRPGPTRVPWDLAALKEAGFTAIVSLECDRINPREIRAAGIEHMLICVDDFTAPTLDQMFEFNEYIDRTVRDDRKVLVHCYAGRGRTGTMLASRLIWRGGSVRDAVAEVRRKIHATQGTLAGAIEPIQVKALHHLDRSLRARRANRSSGRPKT